MTDKRHDKYPEKSTEPVALMDRCGGEKETSDEECTHGYQHDPVRLDSRHQESDQNTGSKATYRTLHRNISLVLFIFPC